MYEDVNVGVDPGIRSIIDTNIGILCDSFHVQNKATIPLNLLCLLSSQAVMNYVCDLLLDRRCATLDEIMETYCDLHVTSVKDDSFHGDGTTHGLIYVTLRNMIDTTNHLLKDKDISASALGHLLAGAYYGGHEHLITKIVDITQNNDHVNAIDFLGYVGALCAGRFHYIEEQVDFDEIDDSYIREASEIITERMILSKDSLTKMLSDDIREDIFHGEMYTALDKCIHTRGDQELIQWFLRSELAVHIRYDIWSCYYSIDTWRFIHEHYDEVVLPQNLRAEIAEKGLPTVIAENGITNSDSNMLKYAVSLGIDYWSGLLTWCSIYNLSMYEELEGLIPSDLRRVLGYEPS